MSSTTIANRFQRDTNYIPDRIVADPQAEWPVEAGRYRLVAARACPWANRALIVRRLLGLEDAISLGMCGPVHEPDDSWTFDLDPGRVDPVLGIPRLKDAYLERFPDYQRGITVPAIVDIPSGHVVTNDFRAITVDFSTQWTAHHRPGAPELYPPESVDEIEELAARVYEHVNDGVYQAGFAGSQAAYDEAYANLFTTLEWLSERLSRQRFLVGDTITEADVRLWPTLARFDAIYHVHFKCNRHKLTEMPVLWAYARDLFQTPGFGDTIDFTETKEHYYLVHATLNPGGIVPAGPDLSAWAEPHHRRDLGGRPFGDGTPPPPPRSDEVVPDDHNPVMGQSAF